MPAQVSVAILIPPERWAGMIADVPAEEWPAYVGALKTMFERIGNSQHKYPIAADVEEIIQGLTKAHHGTERLGHFFATLRNTGAGADV